MNLFYGGSKERLFLMGQFASSESISWNPFFLTVDMPGRRASERASILNSIIKRLLSKKKKKNLESTFAIFASWHLGPNRCMLAASDFNLMANVDCTSSSFFLSQTRVGLAKMPLLEKMGSNFLSTFLQGYFLHFFSTTKKFLDRENKKVCRNEERSCGKVPQGGRERERL